MEKGHDTEAPATACLKKYLSLLINIGVNFEQIPRATMLPSKVFRITGFTLFFLACHPAISQKLSKTESVVYRNLNSHVKYLADDKLEGRRTGTSGEKAAAKYISERFKSIGLQPKGDEGFYQNFQLNDGRFYAAKSHLKINGDSLEAGKYFPWPGSPERKENVRLSMALKELGVPWFLDIKDDMIAAASNPHFDFNGYVSTKATAFAKKGASAILVYNSDLSKPNLEYEPVQHPEALAIPVLILNNLAAKKYFADDIATFHIDYNIAFSDSIRVATNVLGFIDNHAEKTIIIGAHFDHLGYGEDGNSLFRTGEKLIHNGADDNASGVAAMLEMARLQKASKSKKNNYLFAAFTGEELGLFGSKFFTAHPTIDLATVNCMINLDMVGRLNPDTKVLQIGGYGTSPEWSRIFTRLRSVKDFVPKFDSSGVGPSDHTSFYRKDIPVLFFFTGSHGDYHKPTDDADKINFTGETKLVSYLMKITSLLDAAPRAGFLKTREMQMGAATRFAVTLGIMPDYSFDGAGVRVDGVTEGKPAQLAGMQTGDVIIALGDNKISSLENYMQALGKFQKGDSAKLRFKRKDTLVDTTVKF